MNLFFALLAGLSFIHDEENQRGFISFNVMALVVLIAALFVLAGAAPARNAICMCSASS